MSTLTFHQLMCLICVPYFSLMYMIKNKGIKLVVTFVEEKNKEKRKHYTSFIYRYIDPSPRHPQFSRRILGIHSKEMRMLLLKRHPNPIPQSKLSISNSVRIYMPIMNNLSGSQNINQVKVSNVAVPHSKWCTGAGISAAHISFDLWPHL